MLVSFCLMNIWKITFECVRLSILLEWGTVKTIFRHTNDELHILLPICVWNVNYSNTKQSQYFNYLFVTVFAGFFLTFSPPRRYLLHYFDIFLWTSFSVGVRCCCAWDRNYMKSYYFMIMETAPKYLVVVPFRSKDNEYF